VGTFHDFWGTMARRTQPSIPPNPSEARGAPPAIVGQGHPAFAELGAANRLGNRGEGGPDMKPDVACDGLAPAGPFPPQGRVWGWRPWEDFLHPAEPGNPCEEFRGGLGETWGSSWFRAPLRARAKHPTGLVGDRRCPDKKPWVHHRGGNKSRCLFKFQRGLSVGGALIFFTRVLAPTGPHPKPQPIACARLQRKRGQHQPPMGVGDEQPRSGPLQPGDRT